MVRRAPRGSRSVVAFSVCAHKVSLSFTPTESGNPTSRVKLLGVRSALPRTSERSFLLIVASGANGAYVPSKAGMKLQGGIDEC